MKDENSISNILLTTPLDQHMLQTVVRCVPRSCSYC